MADGRAAAVPGQQAHHGREVAARALPHHPDRPGGAGPPAGAQRGGVLGGPCQGGVAVVDSGGEPVPRRQPVVHRHHDGADGHRDVTAEPVAHAERAEDEPAAVVVHDKRPRAGGGPGRAVDPDGEVAARPGDGPVAHLGPRRDLTEEVAGEGVVRDVAGLQGDDLGLAPRRDRGLSPHHPGPQPQPAIDRCHPSSVRFIALRRSRRPWSRRPRPSGPARSGGPSTGSCAR